MPVSMKKTLVGMALAAALATALGACGDVKTPAHTRPASSHVTRSQPTTTLDPDAVPDGSGSSDTAPSEIVETPEITVPQDGDLTELQNQSGSSWNNGVG